MAKLFSWFQGTLAFISGAITRIFGVTDDEYPATGIQPYSGDPAHGH